MSNPLSEHRHCSFRDSILEPLVDPHKSAPNPCFLASVTTAAQGSLGLFLLIQIAQVVTNNRFGPFSIKHSVGNGFSLRSVGASHFVRISVALIHGLVLFVLAYKSSHVSGESVISLSALALLVVTLFLALPLHFLETTRSIVGHGSLFIYWAASILLFSVITVTDLFSPYKVFVNKSDKTLVLTFEITLVLLSTAALGLESLLYKPSKQLLELFDLNGWNTSTVRNPLELLFFTWVNPMISEIHSSEELRKNQVPAIDADLSNGLLYKEFKKSWQAEVKRATWWRDRRISKSVEPTEEDRKVKTSLRLVIFKLHWYQTVVSTLLSLIEVAASIVKPFAIQAFIKFFTFYALIPDLEHKPPLIQGIALGVAIYLLSVVEFLVSSQSSIIFTRIRLSIRSALTAAVYDKVLNLSPEARQEKTTGEIVNLVSMDIANLSLWLKQISSIVVIPLRLLLTLAALYKLFGKSSWAGLLVMLVLSPISSLISASISSLVQALMVQKDKRVKLTSEILNAIKSMKFYAWEKPMLERLHEIRNGQELQTQAQIGIKVAACLLIWQSIPDWVSVGVYGTFGIYSKVTLTPDLIFSSLALFNKLLLPIVSIPFLVIQLGQVKVYLQRVEYFFGLSELEKQVKRSEKSLQKKNEAVSIKNASFFWKKKDAENPRPESNFALKDINFTAKVGELTCLVGKVGSGKTSLLKSIIGELPISEGSSYLKVAGSVAYCSQNAWILNSSIKGNILFGKRFNEDFYNETIDACQLRPDLQTLPNGDETIVGDKGIALSGGQKARLSLARAVYARADIYLLDDILSAVDSYVGRKIIDAVLSSKGLLASRTVVLATNSVKVLQEAKSIYFIKDGSITEHGSFASLKSKGGETAQLISEFSAKEKNDNFASEADASLDVKPVSQPQTLNSEVLSSIDQTDAPITPDVLETVTSYQDLERASFESFDHDIEDDVHKDVAENTSDENRAKGGINKSVVSKLVKACKFQNVALWLGFIILASFLGIASNLILKLWSERNLKAGSNVRLPFYLSLYASCGVLQTLTSLVATYVLWAYCIINCSRYFHDRLAHNVVRAPMSFFDTTPTGRILNRFTADISVTDNAVVGSLAALIQLSVLALVQFFTLVVNLPIISIVLLILVILFRGYRNWYIPASRELKRLEAALKSPIVSHFQESIEGVETLRAYNETDRFTHLGRRMLDDSTKTSYVALNVSNWLSVRLLALSANVVFVTTLLCFLTLFTSKPLSPGMVGFLVTYSVSSTLLLDTIIQLSSNAEVNLVAVERILEYMDMKQEAPEIIESHRPKRDWPPHGSLEFKEYSTSYRPELPTVLNNLNLTIKPAEKIGIVGRTGAGKSSLALAIFRIIEANEGGISIDNIDTSKIGLYDLRKQLNIIPQDAHAFAGTVRENLDPWGKYDDQDLWRVLELAHLKSHFEKTFNDGDKPEQESESHQDGLDVKILEGGSNLSGGQKQLLCLARALLKLSRILVLDEATAAVDVQTDKIIQETIRNEFKDQTILTIAHRLETVMDSDRILVLDKGEVKEFDHPQILLDDESSEFYALCKEAGGLIS